MLIKSKPSKSKIILIGLVNIIFHLNSNSSTLNIDAASIFNNRDYDEKVEGKFGESLDHVETDFLKCNTLFFNEKLPYVFNSAGLKVRLLCFDRVAVAYSGLRKSPLYIAEIINKSKRSKKYHTNIPRVLFSDVRIPQSERANQRDYYNNLFDVDSDLKINNGIPMAPAVRKKTWAVYEEQVAKNINQASGNVYVITGSVYTPSACGLLLVSRQLLEANYDYVPWGADKIVKKSAKVHGMPSRYNLGSCTIGRGVVVPSFIYKLVYDPVANRAWVYWIENTNTEKINALISYSDLVRRTGIDFFPGIKVF